MDSYDIENSMVIGDYFENIIESNENEEDDAYDEDYYRL